MATADLRDVYALRLAVEGAENRGGANRRPPPRRPSVAFHRPRRDSLVFRK
jgi:hypothetical protein